MEQNKKFELLAPAGSPEALNAAVGEGADAVYLGLKNFNARLRGTNFAYSQFEAALNALHKIKRKLYLTLNTVWTEREADRMYQLLGYLSKTSVDGIIVQDFGTLNFLRRYFKQLTVHASTQMNCASSRACNILSTHGVSRVVLARELTLEEIREIRNHTNIELEVFVHGALCVSASGLCLFSSYLGGKSANRGMCTQACRRKYSSVNDESKYYFSPLDLQLIEKLPELALAGVRSFKIEGRMKSADYTGITVAAYRLVLDAIEEERPVFEALKKAQTMLKSDFARQKSCFFIDEKSNVSFLNAGEDGGSGIKIGVISRISGKKALIKNAAQIPETGDTLRIHKSDDSMRSAYKINFIENKDDGSFWCNIPESGFTEGDVIYLMQSKKNSKRYAPVLPKLPDSYKKQPGHESAPEVQFKFYGKPEFAEGFFVSAANIEDLYVIQSIRPSMVILSLDCANAKKLCNNKNILPFKPKEIMLNFVPFYNEDADSEFTNYIPRLFEMGYKTYFINNIAQFSIFKNIKAHLIAGEYLYSFNRAAVEFLSGFNIEGIRTPLENSRQNAERCFEKHLRQKIFITVYSSPQLFRIQANLRSVYNFNSFYDSKGEHFYLTHSGGETLVTPMEPFSILDKIPFLQKAGFKRFIIDFTPRALSKKTYKEVLRSAINYSAIPGASRFNWKNGFYEQS